MKRDKSRGDVTLAALLIISLLTGAGYAIGKKDEQRQQAKLPHGQTIATWDTARGK